MAAPHVWGEWGYDVDRRVLCRLRYRDCYADHKHTRFVAPYSEGPHEDSSQCNYYEIDLQSSDLQDKILHIVEKGGPTAKDFVRALYALGVLSTSSIPDPQNIIGDMMTTREVARLLGVSQQRVRQLDGMLHPHRPGPDGTGERLYTRESIDAYAVERTARRDALAARTAAAAERLTAYREKYPGSRRTKPRFS